MGALSFVVRVLLRLCGIPGVACPVGIRVASAGACGASPARALDRFGLRERSQEAPNAYCQNSRISGVGVGPVIRTCVSRMAIVPVDFATCAVVPVPPIQP
jgi:hypothetical protein